MPLGPLNLCAEADSISTPSSFTFIAICPTACTASVWNSAPWLWATLASSEIGSMVPISLFTSITDTSLVSSVINDDSISGDTIPSLSTGRYATGYPSRSMDSQACSIA